MNATDRKIIQLVHKWLEESTTFYVQAREQDGDATERMTVSYGGDPGRWFTMILEFPGVGEKS